MAVGDFVYTLFTPTNLFFSDTDLHAVIKKGSLLKDIHKRYVMYQLLKATKYLHSGNVIHRDQKVCRCTQLLILLHA